MQNWTTKIGEFYYDQFGRNVMPTYIPQAKAAVMQLARTLFRL
jgi:hypothetical protein